MVSTNFHLSDYLECCERGTRLPSDSPTEHRLFERFDGHPAVQCRHFLFVTTAIDAVEGGQLRFDDVENQPPGHLSSLCEVFFNRLFRDAGVDFQASGPVLEMVAAAREPLSRKQTVAVTGLDAEKELRPSPRVLGRVCTCPGGTLFALPPLAV